MPRSPTFRRTASDSSPVRIGIAFDQRRGDWFVAARAGRCFIRPPATASRLPWTSVHSDVGVDLPGGLAERQPGRLDTIRWPGWHAVEMRCVESRFAARTTCGAALRLSSVGDSRLRTRLRAGPDAALTRCVSISSRRNVPANGFNRLLRRSKFGESRGHGRDAASSKQWNTGAKSAYDVLST